MMRWLPIALLLLFALPAVGQVSYQVRPVSFNSNEADEFAPVYYKDGLVFASNRKNGVLLEYNDASNKPLTELYYCAQKRGRKFEKPALFSRQLSTIFHDGPASFNQAGTLVAFNRNNDVSSKFGNYLTPDNKLGIYFADLVDEEWTNIRPFEHNNHDHSFGHPALSPDGNTLYFISDEPGGRGGTDLYVSQWEDGHWTEPENLGGGINTDGNEMFPFLHENGMLFFASDGLEGLGGLDVYYTQRIEGIWVQPTHLKAPLNSKKDDFGFISDATNQQGFVCSNRGRSDDVYAWEAVFPSFEECDSLILNNYCFGFYETSSMDLDSMPLKYEWDLGDGAAIRNLEAEHCYSGPGKYLVMLNIIDTMTGDVFFNEASYELLIENEIQPYITSPDSLKPNVAVRFDGIETNLPDWEVDEYVWDFGDGVNAFGLVVEHAFRAPGIYSVQLGVNGKPDSAGVAPKACVFKTVVVSDSLLFDASQVTYSDVKQAAFDYRDLPLDPTLIALSELVDATVTPLAPSGFDLYELAPDASYFSLMIAHDSDTIYLNSKREALMALAELEDGYNFFEVIKAIDMEPGFTELGRGFDYSRLPPDVNTFGLVAALNNWFKQQGLPQPTEVAQEAAPEPEPVREPEYRLLTPDQFVMDLLGAMDEKLGGGAIEDFDIKLLDPNANFLDLLAVLNPEGTYQIPQNFAFEDLPPNAHFLNLLEALNLSAEFQELNPNMDFTTLRADITVVNLLAALNNAMQPMVEPESKSNNFYPDVLPSMLGKVERIEVMDPGEAMLEAQGLKLEVVYSVEVASSPEQIPLEDPVFEPLKPDYEVKETFAGKDSLFHYSVGEEEEVLDTYEIYEDVKARGFEPTIQTTIVDTVPLKPAETVELVADRWDRAVERVQSPAYPELEPAAAPENLRTKRVHILYFETGAYELDAADIDNLKQVVKRLRDKPNTYLDLAGHTDNRGTHSANVLLSKNRALATREFLLIHGIDESRISFHWHGDSEPLDSNAAETGRQLNRRVELRLLKEPGK